MASGYFYFFSFWFISIIVWIWSPIMLGSFSFFLTSTLLSFSSFFIYISILSFLHLLIVNSSTFVFFWYNQWMHSLFPVLPARLINPLGSLSVLYLHILFKTNSWDMVWSFVFYFNFFFFTYFLNQLKLHILTMINIFVFFVFILFDHRNVILNKNVIKMLSLIVSKMTLIHVVQNGFFFCKICY